ncbi:MAG: SpoIID/LytB domain-containing protein [Chloroflexi bacterium]|nr:MAG: SpoIID/LytB domain-containing protein [Chloroflexota bacterium]
MTVLRLLVDSRIIEFHSIDAYLLGVVPREMPALWPMEALKAQAIVARSYAAFAYLWPRHGGASAHLCNTTHCQMWRSATHPRTDQAVMETAGKVLTYHGRIAQTFYSARCGGRTVHAWNPAAAPWCQPVDCPCGPSEPNGHRRGLCQHGARIFAEQGWDHEQIVLHYFANVKFGHFELNQEEGQ